LVLGLALAGAIAACDSNVAPTPAGPRPTPTATPPPGPTATPVPPTDTPVPTPTEGPVRTPVGGAAGPEFGVALAAMDAVPSYRYRLNLDLGAAATRYSLVGSGEYQAPDRWIGTFNTNGFSAGVLTIGPDTYVRSYGVWTKGPPDATLFPMGAPPAVGRVVGLLTYAADAGLVGEGTELLGDVPARHFRFRLRPPVGPTPDLAATGGELWTDPETHLFRHLLLNLGLPDSPAGGTLQMDFTDYGAAIQLTPPVP
jgi:hypothetical protein